MHYCTSKNGSHLSISLPSFLSVSSYLPFLIFSSHLSIALSSFLSVSSFYLPFLISFSAISPAEVSQMALTCCACASPEQVSSRRLQPPVLPTLHHQGHAARGGPGGGLRFAQVSLRCHRDHSKYTGLSSLHAGYLSTSYMVSNQYCITRALPKLKTYDGDVSIVQVCTYDLVGSKNG